MSLPEPKTSVVNPESPWLGLRPFTEGAREYFFGRDAEVRDIFQRVVHKPLTVLFGRSGLGKTSLLQAALVPRLRDAGFLPIVLRLIYAEGAAPLVRQFVDALLTALTPSLPGLDASLAGVPADARLAWLLFHDPEYRLTTPEAPRPVVLLDQFEEIFTMGQGKSEHQAATAEFLEMLADLVENRVPESLRALLETDDALADRLDYAARPAKVLLSLREDFLHLLERYRGRMPALMDNRFELRLLTGPQALEAVIEPGRLRCLPGTELAPIVSEATGGAIVRFVAGAAPDVPLSEIDAVPPLLSLLCAELNEQRLAAGESVIRPGQLEGRAEDILKQFYERCFASQPSVVRMFIEDRLLSAAGFRESTTLDTATDELVRKGGLTPVASATAIAQLVDARLLTSEERGGIRRIELTHDILTSVARRSRDARLERRAVRARRRRRARFIGLTLGLALLLAGVSVPLAVWALREKGAAQQKEKEAQDQARMAETRRLAAQDSEKRANAARDQADGLINFMLHDLRDKLEPIGRLDVLDDVAQKAKEYLDSLPKELVTVRRLNQQAGLLSNLGDVRVAQGKLQEALGIYSQSLAIYKRLAEQDKSSSSWQQGLTAMYARVGDVLRSQGKLDEALKAYQQYLTIEKGLTERDKSNSDWQRGLGAGYDRVGEVLQAQGKLQEALDAHQQELAIDKRLSEQDKSNSNWQRDLSIAYNKVGNDLTAQGKLQEALDAYQQGLAIAKRLTEQDKSNSDWQRDLGISYERVGEALEEQGRLQEALYLYQQSLKVRQKLCEQDKSNWGWQRDLSISYNKVGNILA